MLALTPPAEAAKRKKLSAEDLTNFMLAPRYSRWLVGPISRIATDQEIEEYLAIDSDAEAEAFIAEFWQSRGGDAVWPAKNKQKIFEERVELADKLYSEGTFRGSTTARGTIFVLYGEPDQVQYEAPPKNRGGPIEVWRYTPETVESLDGSKPDVIYLFRKEGNKTVLYRGPRRLGV
ncbi:MAG: GWxTD domain-containing protein [Acidobacteriota bacterium]